MKNHIITSNIYYSDKVLFLPDNLYAWKRKKKLQLKNINN